MRRLYYALAIITLLTLAIPLFPKKASAVTKAEWQAGRIIDDYAFSDKGSMSLAEVQNFLNSKMSSCDTNGTGSVTYQWPSNSGTYITTSRAEYGNRKGNPTPFTCLRDYFEVPKTTPGPGTPASNYGNVAIPAGAKSAAQIILDAAQAYSISPKVLLVTLQKEQGLITDDWPFQGQYLYAMGSNCPDGPSGAQCDPNYAGFSIQMYSGAKLFRDYLTNMTQPWWSLKKPYQVNNILWQDVNAKDCGSGPVYIQTMATAALYTYTPYQPNDAALNNMYGTGDSCSAYGNRNFWRTFSDWFGTTYGNLFQAALVSQTASPTLLPGQSQQMTVKYRNAGQWTWHDDTVSWPGIPSLHLATANTTKHPSIFSFGWPNSGETNLNFTAVYEADGTTLAANQHLVNPGQIVVFSFPISVPWTAGSGTYTEYFKPFLSSEIDLGDLSLTRVDVDVPTNFRASIVTQSVYPTLVPGEQKLMMVRYKNTGAWAWHDDTVSWPGMPPVYLATTNSNNISIFGYGWPTRNYATKTFAAVYEADGVTKAANQHVANFGQIVEFQFNLTAPWNVNIGTYRESFKPVLTGTDYNLTGPTSFDVNIPAWQAQRIGANPTGSLVIPTGGGAWARVKYRNTGAWTWHDSQVNWPGVPPVGVVTANPNNISIFSTAWINQQTANNVFEAVYEADGTTLAANQHVVTTNQIVQIAFPMITPWAAQQNTSYQEYFKLALLGNNVPLTDSSNSSNIQIFVPSN